MGSSAVNPHAPLRAVPMFMTSNLNETTSWGAKDVRCIKAPVYGSVVPIPKKRTSRSGFPAGFGAGAGRGAGFVAGDTTAVFVATGFFTVVGVVPTGVAEVEV